jgi:hypothetical protein
MKRLGLLLLLSALVPLPTFAAEPVEVNYEMQRLDVRYRLFKTVNTWIFLELDTQTGKVWQVQFSGSEKEGRSKIEIRPDADPTGTKPGKFTLYPTKNLLNFILLDQDGGKTWQVQWGTNKEQGSWPIEGAAPTAR